MGTVTVLTAARMLEIEAESIVSGIVNGFGHLILTNYGGDNFDAGLVLAPNLADSSTTVKGIVELATSAETITGTDTVRAVTPKSLADKFADSSSFGTTAQRGLLQLASSAEVITGTDTAKGITPAGFAAGIAAGFGPFEANSIAFASVPNSFPKGISIGIVNGDAGWPTNTATIITHYESTTRSMQTVYDKTSGRTYVRTNSSISNVWGAFIELHSDVTPQAPFAMAAGSGTTGSSIASLANLNVSPTFPASRFTQAPIVTATTGSARLTTGTSAVTTSGFTLSLSNWSNATAPTAIEYDWVAIQMTSSSAAG